jgi:hypothetical protein
MATKLGWKHYGLDVYEVDGEEWAVGTDAQATRAAREDILDHLWAFNASFIGRLVGLTDAEEKALEKMQRDLSEDANALVRRIVGERNIDKLVREAIREDGRGHFLSGYDGEERESDEIEGLPKGKFAYRQN